MTNPKYCINCEATLGLQVAFCGSCGNRVDDQSQATGLNINDGGIEKKRIPTWRVMLGIDTYSHVMPGLEEAAARRIDDILGDAVAGNS